MRVQMGVSPEPQLVWSQNKRSKSRGGRGIGDSWKGRKELPPLPCRVSYRGHRLRLSSECLTKIPMAQKKGPGQDPPWGAPTQSGQGRQ